ncbi:c-type cytochrome [Hydrogenimonas sp.]|uniref:c-type cytochrome n=1 Tax=Hydrogenimonas sp. TaxID=2231112 RepID=UPI0026291B65|nr:c-type cytochrome [Hydrogenimonas sp.]
MGKLLWTLLLASLFALASEGEKIYMGMGCYGCHGVKGEGIGDYPKIGGKPIGYLVKKLHDLQQGIGYSSKRDMMIPFAKGLNEKQIKTVSHYLSTIDRHGQEKDVPEEILGGFGS